MSRLLSHGCIRSALGRITQIGLVRIMLIVCATLILNLITPSPAVMQGCVDDDLDGYCAGTGPGEDCDDFNPFIHPGADEYCDTRDNDCDGEVDEDPVNPLSYYEDRDGDGYGNAETLVLACQPPDAYFISTILGFDCDDRDAAVYPGAIEECDGIDNDCDGTIDGGFPSSGSASPSGEKVARDRIKQVRPGMQEKLTAAPYSEAESPPAPQLASVFFGGRDPATGEVERNGVWDFKDGNMQGWTVVDATKTEQGFRRITAADFSGPDVPLILASTGSIWCGRTEDEVADQCWPGGRGYGNMWNVEARKTFTYMGGAVILRYHYFTDSETEYDLTFLYVEANGFRSDPLNSSPNGNWAGYGYAGSITEGNNLGIPDCPVTEIITIPPVYLPEVGEEFTVIFSFLSDGARSDEDGHLGFDSNGGFGFDNFLYMTEDEFGAYETVEYNDFETGTDGWTFDSPCVGDFVGLGTHSYGCPDFIEPEDHFLYAADLASIGAGGEGHPEGQHVYLISPSVYVGDFGPHPGVKVWFDVYNEYTVYDGGRFMAGVHYYPFHCPETGSDIWTVEPVATSAAYYHGSMCGTRVRNCSPFVPADVESLKVVLEFAFDCIFGCHPPFEGSDEQKTTPFFKDIRLEIIPDECTGVLADLGLEIGSSTWVAGFQRDLVITYWCTDASVSDVQIILDIPSPLACVSVSDGGSVTSTGAVWNLEQLYQGYTRQVTATIDLSEATMGDIATVSARIEPVAGDCNPENNYDSVTGEVYGAWDPNAKSVSPEGFIANTDLLKYHIDFQNVGTYQAYKVVIRDTIDQNLDLSTLTPGASSHRHVFEVSGNEATWTFYDINLPDSISDEPGSHGFVEYEILPVSGLMDGTVIENHAAIYFDFNPAVITNSAIVQIGIPVAVQLSFLSATLFEGSVEVAWEAAFENDIAGYHVYRSENDAETPRRITEYMIPGRGGRQVKYSFVDESPTPGRTYIYAVESIDINGDRNMFQTQEISTPAQLMTLYQNWPNPFNPSTTIKYYLAENCSVLLEIFNVSGKRIATLVSESQETGQYEIDWNGQDINGNPVSSGTYFYRLKAGKETISKKMVLLR